MSTALQRESVARVGARVRATDRADAAHTDRAVVISLVEVAPVALCRFNCGCISYVPLRRLALDIGPAIPACEVAGCRRPRWDGPYCSAHPQGGPAAAPAARIGESFEPQARDDPSPSPSAQNGCAAIDDLGTKARGGSTPSPHARQPRATGTAAARSGAGVRPCAPAPGRMIWTRERVIAALRTWAAEHGQTPAFGDWERADPGNRRPTSWVVRERFGSWSGGVAAAGLVARGDQPRRRKWTREGIIAALQAHHRATGQTPRRYDWKRSTDEHPCGMTVADVFGTWNAGILAAGLTPRPPGRPRRGS